MNARHVMIRASAGSGKTYALTNRFVQLLARGAAPDRIVALTFTRKAAGEFFDEILNKLGRAAAEAPFAAKLASEIGRPDLGQADFLGMLRAMVEAMPRLHLGTLDGFFGRIARAFPLELGLAGDFEILQEHGVQLERRRVLQHLFAGGEGGLGPAQREFIEAFKRATFGAEEKRLGMRLDAFLDAHQEKFLSAPAAEAWGDPARIWPDGCEWLESAPPDPARLLEVLRGEILRRTDLAEKQVARWSAFFTALPEWTPGAPLPAPVAYLVKNALLVWPALQLGDAAITVERTKVRLGPAESAALAGLVRFVMGGELMRHLEITRGIHAVLAAFEASYHDAVRRSGKLTFGDVQRLLLPEASGLALARDAARGETAGVGGRLWIDYRLDAQFDHWLLDEFQDTSYGQWRVLENLIDEVVQDAGGARSFFCVGDVKQAIFTWREGDPRLFGDILERYRQGAPKDSGGMTEEHLVKSYRSGPAVIEMVNAVFGASAAIAALFPGAASAAWNREWRAHETARPQLNGYATWLPAAEPEDRLACLAELLQAIQPLARGLECAVLVQTNAMATAVATYLRGEAGIPALAESDLKVGTDNPLGVALLALVQMAAHPGDTLARGHVAMSPLGEVLVSAGLTTPEAVTECVLGQIHADGFERTVEHWVRRLEPKLAPEDAFSRERGRQLVAAAARFDATGSRDAAEFVAFVERHAVRGPDVAGVVRVMTLHKSKGLGFDVVFLPDLEGQRIDQRRDGLAVQRTPDRMVEWVFDLPPKVIAEQDGTLRAHIEQAEAEACYEALSLLYVGLTRAKRAMYLITKDPGKSESRNYPRLLADALGEVPWSHGEARWYEGLPLGVRPSGPGAVSPEGRNAGWRRAPRRPARRPSGEKGGVVEAGLLLRVDRLGMQAVEFGTALHALLSAVEWSDDRALELWWGNEWPPEVVAEAKACLQAPGLAHVWRRPAAGEVWRERAFEIVLDGAWVTGVFDRVVVERGPNGAVLAVAVFDFKTDRLENELSLAAAAGRHAGQMRLYRRVAAVMCGFPLDEIRSELIFTAYQQAVPLDADAGS
jgi:ATP-dependent helicase/nuclease subunit A